MIERLGMKFEMYAGIQTIPCPVVTNVQELYATEDVPSNVLQTWLTSAETTAIIRGNFTSLGVGVYGNGPLFQYVAIFVTVENQPLNCPSRL